MKYKKEMDDLFNEVLVNLKDESKFKPVTQNRTWSSRNKTKFSAVYLISHFKSGKIYVGSTGDIEQRLYDHVNKLLRKASDVKSLQLVFDDDNRIKFNIIIIESKQEALECEQYLLTNHIKSGILFNQGENAKAPRLGIKNTEEQNIALSERSSLYWKQKPELKKRFIDLMAKEDIVTKRLNTLNILRLRISN